MIDILFLPQNSWFSQDLSSTVFFSKKNLTMEELIWPSEKNDEAFFFQIFDLNLMFVIMISNMSCLNE